MLRGLTGWLGCLLAMAPLWCAAAEGDAEKRWVLTSSEASKRTDDLEIHSRDLGWGGETAWSVRKTTLHGGKQEGVELVTIDNGAMQITVVPTRGMSILDVRAGDVRLGWESPVKEVVHPHYINLESRGGLGWLEGFNEWMVRCGLEYAGHPGLDEFVDNTGATAQMNLTLHGKIGNIPASEVELIVDREPPYRIRLRGTVHERCFFGPKLTLTTELSVTPGELGFRLEDSVTNGGASDQECQLIYHVNYGAPLLEEGARVVAPLAEVMPMNDHASDAIGHFDRYAAPKPGYIEQVYLTRPKADDDGHTLVLLRNAAGTAGSSIAWSIEELPYLTIWKNTAAREDGYVTGLEPATCYPYNRKVEREAGRLIKLAPGETRRFTLDFGLHPTSESVAQIESRIARIQGSDPPVLHTKPPVAE